MPYRKTYRTNYRKAYTEHTEGEEEAGKLPYEPGSEEEMKASVRKAMNLLLYKDRSVKELNDRLSEAGFSQEAVRAALEYVSSFGYLNDKRYAENYVYSMRDRKSRAVIIRELEEKGVDYSLIEEAAASLESDESERVYQLLVRRAGDPHKMDEKELRRMFGYIGRKGFSSGDFWKAVRKYQNE
ncbi:MAG: regulatory protein RecX [Eubacterium sp.]|nr:regulatory protein RecX [Eubacterium sp.]